MIESLNCNACGAPLEIPESANYAKCNHCQGNLLIRRTESTTYSELVESLAAKSSSMEGQLDELRLRQAVTELDAQWMTDREKFFVDGENGRHAPPTPEEFRKQTHTQMVAFLIWMLFLAGMHIPALSQFGQGGFMILAFDIFVVFGFLYVFAGHQESQLRVAEFAAATSNYQSKRKKLTDQISSNAKNPGSSQE